MNETYHYKQFQYHLILMQLRPLAIFLNTGESPAGYDFAYRSVDALLSLREAADNNGIPWNHLVDRAGIW